LGVDPNSGSSVASMETHQSEEETCDARSTSIGASLDQQPGHTDDGQPKVHQSEEETSDAQSTSIGATLDQQSGHTDDGRPKVHQSEEEMSDAQRTSIVASLDQQLGHTDDGQPKVLMLFDGLCRLCQIFCSFIIERDPHKKVAFAPLQSNLGQEILQAFRFPTDLDSMVLYANGEAHVKSDAALMALGILDSWWSALSYLSWMPQGLRDFGYEIVAKNRYGVLGHATADDESDQALAARLLDTWTPSEENGQHVCNS